MHVFMRACAGSFSRVLGIDLEVAYGKVSMKNNCSELFQYDVRYLSDQQHLQPPKYPPMHKQSSIPFATIIDLLFPNQSHITFI